ncbi:MAG: dipeptide epimerase [Ferruginibacter sp.]|nr:dipeptide epimerase [Bacteroidota bacterium]MBX2918843.1 dipeptide epimerase [Ferruginibacter sp.]MCB0708060.1 dipeptide epimerase [Chitinophagaceae bacterium]MCC7378177.1 dipeptide epimerase [Chitinophagaceae bacterium]
MKLTYKTYSLPFHHPFTISKGTKTHQPTLIVQLDFMGIKGYGEAPAISYYNIPVEKMVEDIERKKIFIEKFAFSDPERYWHYLHHLFPNNSFLVCALDMAGWDIYGKLKRKQLHELWQLDTSKAPLTDFTIAIDSIETMVAKMKEKPWPVYKIKTGVDGDLEMVAALRKHTDAIFRVDANAGWTLEQALQKIPVLKELGVELVEQPLAKDDWDGMKVLFEKSALPLIADESCVAETDVEKCLNHFHGINIKLTKCSGITPARRMITKAKELGMQVMVGCMNESSVGTAAIAQLAPMLNYVDMDGPLLLAEDIGESVKFDFGKIIYNQSPGLGINNLSL